MIDEKKLIEDFRKCHISFNGTPMEESDMMISYRSLVRVINNQPKVNEWIPCDERLPELDEGCESFKQSRCCLCTVKWWDGDITEEVGWYNQTGIWNLDGESCKVIAWTPLPEPYKEL